MSFPKCVPHCRFKDDVVYICQANDTTIKSSKVAIGKEGLIRIEAHMLRSFVIRNMLAKITMNKYVNP